MSGGDVKRFSLVSCLRDGEEWTGLQRHTDGPYVAFADHERIVAELRAEVERLKQVRKRQTTMLINAINLRDDTIATQKRVIEKSRQLYLNAVTLLDELTADKSYSVDDVLARYDAEIAALEKEQS